MALAIKELQITDSQGNVLAGASVEVRRESAGSPVAALKSDRAGATPISNPMTSDANGMVTFYVVGGAYKFTITKDSYSKILRYQPVGTAQEYDVADILGSSAGVDYTFSATTTDADPGAGIIRLNHATLASVTAAYIDNVNKAGSTVTGWLDSLDDMGSATNRGLITIFNKESSGENFRIYRVTGSVVNGTGYRKLTLVHVDGAGVFTADDTLVLVFASSGADGARGAGLPFTFDGASTADANPGTGKLRVNHATPASITKIYISESDSNAVSVAAAEAIWDDSTTTNARGYLIVRDIATPANFLEFVIVGANVDASSYKKIDVTYVAGGGLTDLANISVEFSRTGNIGATGADGVTAGIRWNFDSSTTTAADPGTGDFRLNNASLTSVTEITISDLCGASGNPDASAYVLAWDDAGSAPYGHLILKKMGAEQNFAIYNVGALNDQSGYTRVALTHVASAGSFSNTDPVSLLFVRGGSSGSSGIGTDLLINGDGRIDQRGEGVASTTADDAYGSSDRWYSLTQTASITVQRLTNGENGTPYYQQLKQTQASAQRMGRAQIILGATCRHLRAQQATLSGRICCSSSQAIRYAILEWTGTEDAVTSDVVNSWTNATFTAGQFFNSTTLNVLGVGTITPSAATWTDLSALTVTCGSSLNNLIVMIWTEGTAAQNVTLDFRAKLEKGSSATAFSPRFFNEELARCQAYFFRKRSRSTGEPICILHAYNTTAAWGKIIDLPTEMRTEPSITFSSLAHMSLWNASAAASYAVTSTNISTGASRQSIGAFGNVTASTATLAAGNATQLSFNSASGYIDADAEL